MRQRLINVSIALCVLIALAACGGAASGVGSTPATSTAASTAPPVTTSWHTVQTFDGTQDQQTATVHVKNGDRFVYTAKSTGSSGVFAIVTYNSDNSYNDLVANTQLPPDASGTYNVHADADVYLKITALQCTYTIAVETPAS